MVPSDKRTMLKIPARHKPTPTGIGAVVSQKGLGTLTDTVPEAITQEEEATEKEFRRKT